MACIYFLNLCILYVYIISPTHLTCSCGALEPLYIYTHGGRKNIEREKTREPEWEVITG